VCLLSNKAYLQDELVEQCAELEWLREQVLRVAAELEANGPRKRRMLDSKTAVESLPLQSQMAPRRRVCRMIHECYGKPKASLCVSSFFFLIFFLLE